jgi:hypothetical protein
LEVVFHKMVEEFLQQLREEHTYLVHFQVVVHPSLVVEQQA